MLSPYDWLRRCRSGAELIATLNCLEEAEADWFPTQIGPPHTAFGGPCQRCWVYLPLSKDHPPAHTDEKTQETGGGKYCRFCQAVRDRVKEYGRLVRSITFLWGFVNQISPQFEERLCSGQFNVLGKYIEPPHHFLIVMPKRNLMDWLRELLLYHGTELRGLLQIFPSVGSDMPHTMGDYLVRVAHEESIYPLDRLRVRFYPAPYLLLRPHVREREGMLTFEIAEFMNLLEMASVFRSMLRPETQQILFGLLNFKNEQEAMFYWGRFLGLLSPESRDMLNAWRIRRWPRLRVKLLHELTEYVAFSPTD